MGNKSFNQSIKLVSQGNTLFDKFKIFKYFCGSLLLNRKFKINRLCV